MLFELLFSIVTSFLNLILGIFPSLPDVDPAIETAANGLVGLVTQSVGLLIALVSPPLFVAVIASFILLFQFETVYHLIIWLIRKIPISIH